MNLLSAARALAREVDSLRFGSPVTHVYNPLVYAWEAHAEYITRYGRAPKDVVLLGMNPGPWGMAQTGVPFGAVPFVRDWLRITAPIGRPDHEHPQRPVLGLKCPRTEISGKRLWGWARDRFSTPGKFFARFFVLNYCPLLFLQADGESVQNLPVDKLRASDSAALLAACDRHLRRAIEILNPRFLVGVGAFAESRVHAIVGDDTTRFTVGRILHPSGANPKASKNWSQQAERDLAALGVHIP